MPDKHAVLSASSSHRWLACPPSALLCAKEKDKPSEFSLQGTDAHTLCEHKLKTGLGQQTKDPTEDLTFFDEEMADCTDMYAQYVMEQLSIAKEKCSDPIVLVEQHLDFSQWVPEGFGTGEHISTFSISKEALLSWAEKTLAPTAQLAAKGEGEYKAGSHCQFCKVKSTCRKRAEYNLELARYDFEMPESLEDDEIEVILAKADELVSWTNDIKEYALQKAVSGKEWKDWKLVEGRSNRRYVNDKAVAEKIESAGYDPYEKKVIGITAMTKMLGKTKFEELLSGLIEKPQGKPTLVPMSDKRPAMKNTAVNDFKEDN